MSETVPFVGLVDDLVLIWMINRGVIEVHEGLKFQPTPLSMSTCRKFNCFQYWYLQKKTTVGFLQLQYRLL